MEFRVSDSGSRVERSQLRTTVVLRRDGWDDFGFKTSFHAELVPRGGEPIELGMVKILASGQTGGRTQFDSNRFSELGARYCSIGQDIEYYEKLASLDIAERNEFLRSIRDAAVDGQIASEFENEPGWETSLVRFGQAQHSLESARALFPDRSTGAESPQREPGRRGSLEGRAEVAHQRSDLETDLRLVFDDTGVLPGRCKVLIGYNGVGKTRLLADIARDTSKVGAVPRSERGNSGSTFSSVIAVSYSAFDTFELPFVEAPTPNNLSLEIEESSTTTRFGYTYCGLRKVEGGQASTQLKSIQELERELMSAFEVANLRSPSALRDSLVTIEADPSFGRVALRPSDWCAEGRIPMAQLILLSSGQKIVLNILIQLAAHLRKRSLVLLDEPETHLHPSLLAATLRGVQRLLDSFDSFAIVATHSPVVLQEVPSKDVQVIERFGSIVRAASPRLETFGAGIGELTHEAFGLDNSMSDHREIVRELAAKMSLESFENLFPDGLSSQARALALRAMRETQL